MFYATCHPDAGGNCYLLKKLRLKVQSNSSLLRRDDKLIMQTGLNYSSHPFLKNLIQKRIHILHGGRKPRFKKAKTVG
jgi:hypothetical protein